jgi:hypothetical protein
MKPRPFACARIATRAREAFRTKYARTIGPGLIIAQGGRVGVPRQAGS